MNPQYTYFLILGASFIGPLALSFDKKVAFYTKWKYLLPAIVIPALLYMAWDMYFTKQGVWRFNEKYISGIHIGNLPIEEVLFFFIVPYCCVFIYECIRCYFPQLKNKQWVHTVLKITAVACLFTGIIFYDRYYTSWTFLFTAAFIVAIYLLRSFFARFDAVSFLVSFLITLVPFLVVNGFLTAIPVVLYNDAENMNFRITTIPFEDTFYGMLLMLMNVCIYEKLMKRK
jgi:lycopene cyclase domain-containing protein